MMNTILLLANIICTIIAANAKVVMDQDIYTKEIVEAFREDQQKRNLVDKCSNLHPNDRISCGWPGINQHRCVDGGCCFDNTIADATFCFLPAKTTAKVQNVKENTGKAAKLVAGLSGTWDVRFDEGKAVEAEEYSIKNGELTILFCKLFPCKGMKVVIKPSTSPNFPVSDGWVKTGDFILPGSRRGWLFIRKEKGGSGRLELRYFCNDCTKTYNGQANYYGDGGFGIATRHIGGAANTKVVKDQDIYTKEIVEAFHELEDQQKRNLDASVDQCSNLHPNDRISCGWPGINHHRCVDGGCCFDNTIAHATFCFLPAKKTAKVQNVEEDRGKAAKLIAGLSGTWDVRFEEGKAVEAEEYSIKNGELTILFCKWLPCKGMKVVIQPSTSPNFPVSDGWVKTGDFIYPGSRRGWLFIRKEKGGPGRLELRYFCNDCIKTYNGQANYYGDGGFGIATRHIGGDS